MVWCEAARGAGASPDLAVGDREQQGRVCQLGRDGAAEATWCRQDESAPSLSADRTLQRAGDAARSQSSQGSSTGEREPSSTRANAAKSDPVTDITIEIGDLATRTEAIVGPAGSEILIGQLVLEALDLIADCRNRTLAPRHPEGPVLAIR